jgi:hypothetical protein
MHVMYDEEEDPNVKRMHVVEEEVSLSQPETAAVPPEEDEVAVPQGPSIAVPPEEEVPPKEEEFPAPAIAVLQPPPSHGPAEEEEVPTAPLITVLLEGRGCLVPISALVSSLPFFFFLKMQEILLALFSHKRGRFVGLERDLC